MAANESRPNVLIFILDQQRYDHLGFTGNDTVSTPNVDALADRGVSCDRTYVSNPVCMPSRASILTGRMPRDAIRFNGSPLDERHQTLPGILADAGYRTHAAGKLHLSHYSLPSDAEAGDIDPESHPECRAPWNTHRIESLPEPYYGFETTDFVGGHTAYVHGEYVQWLEDEHPDIAEDILRDEDEERGMQWRDVAPERVHYNRWIADRSRECIREEDDDPFFLWCSFPDPHPPFAVPEPWDAMYDPEEVALPTRREGELDDLPPHHSETEKSDHELREEIATAYGMTSFVDQEIGRVLETLESEGLSEETLVVFTSDHGDLMGDHWGIRKGPQHFDGVVRVPLVWSWPGHLPEGRQTDGVVSGIDLLPTILDYCGLDVPEPGHAGYAEPDCGLPALAGQSIRPQLAGDTDGVREGAIVEFDGYDSGLRARTYVTERHKLTVYPGEEYGELFDLADDPDELYNRWDDPAYAEIRDRLSRELLDAYVRHESCLPRKPSRHA